MLELLGHGESNKAIARRLNIREGTVKVHVRHIMRRMGVANRTQVAIAASSGNGDVPPDSRGPKGRSLRTSTTRVLPKAKQCVDPMFRTRA